MKKLGKKVRHFENTLHAYRICYPCDCGANFGNYLGREDVGRLN